MSTPKVFLTGLTAALAGGLTVGCYTVEFNENTADAYYCKADEDCLASQACVQFRCVADIGPQVEIKLPESLTPIDVTETSFVVDYEIANFEISDSNENIEGQGKVLIRVDDSETTTLSNAQDGVVVELEPGLELGAHRVWVQAVYGDGETVYANPGATAYQVFFIKEKTMAGDDSLRPRIAIVSPGPNHTHVLGEPLSVSIAVNNFTIIENGNNCRIEEGCDPWDESTPECVPACLEDEDPSGHAHIYIEPDYPACLFDTPINCNGAYILSLRPSEALMSDGKTVTAEIDINKFTEPGTYTFSASLNYNDHDPYPNRTFAIYDQITLTVVE